MSFEFYECLINELAQSGKLSDENMSALLTGDYPDEMLFGAADRVRRNIYGDEVYIRGLIEFTDYCKNNCYYCGIRAGNKKAERYRLTKEDILSCCENGYALGFRTFVLQGGEDPFFGDGVIVDIVSSMRSGFPDCAITLSMGERSEESYRRLFEAGANRYLLRHETALAEHYGKLHPASMSLENRKKCLFALKKIGYQVGSGFMVGSPYQTVDNLVADINFLRELKPDMIGIGPFIHHRDTPFADFADGSVKLTLRLVSVLRLSFPYALIPSTTALGTLHPNGRELGLKAGANVIMPNLSPTDARKKYELYENKISAGAESAEGLQELKQRVQNAGYRIVTNIGNAKTFDVK